MAEAIATPPHNKAKGKDTPYKAGPQFAEGDPAKGRDPEKDIPFFIEGPQIAMRDRRAYLLDQAAKNESANDEINAKQVEHNQKLAEILFEALDPDKLREETTQAALDEIDSHTPEGAEKAKEQRLKILAANKDRFAGLPAAAKPPVHTAPPPPERKDNK